MRKIVFLLSIATSIFVINNLVHSIVNLWGKRDLSVIAEKTLEAKKKENTELKKKLSQVESREFIEGEARNKLFMSKPGEKAVVIPSDLLKASEAAKKKKDENKPNWKKWWELFFH